MKLPKKIRREWRDFEKVVATVEDMKRGANETVTWNDSVVSKCGIARQIDVTVRSRINDDEVLTMIECQHRGRKPGVQWVDSVVGKRTTLPADAAIMVAKSGFCKSAQLTAAAEDIELRTLVEIPSETVRDMFPNRVEYHEITKRLDSIQFHLRGSTPRSLADELNEALLAEEPVWIGFPDGEKALLREAANEAVAVAPLPEIKPDFTSTKYSLSLLPTTLNSELHFRNQCVEVVQLYAEYIVEVTLVNAETNFGHYTASRGDLDDLVARSEVEIEGAPLSFTTIGPREGNFFRTSIPREFVDLGIQPWIDPTRGVQIEVYVDEKGQINMKRVE